MQSYFPYSQIINFCKTFKQSIQKHAYFGEWWVGDGSASETPQTQSLEISELYY